MGKGFAAVTGIAPSTPEIQVDIALVHHPVVDKQGGVITSAVTNLDLHDIARAARTYGVRSFFVVTPLEDQQVLAKRILDHWREGFGARYNPDRREALGLVRVVDSLQTLKAAVAAHGGGAPEIVATSCHASAGTISHHRLQRMMDSGRPYTLIFGTAWGLAPEVTQAADWILEPIIGRTAYNHLSVRSAASIVLDRLLG